MFIKGVMTHRACALLPMPDHDTGKTGLFQAHFKAEEDTANTLHIYGAIIQSLMVWFTRLRTTQKIILVIKLLS